MDYSKFMQLLTQKSLYFCGSRNFIDPFEGQYAWGKTGNRKFVETQRKLHIKNGGGIDFEFFMAMNMKTLNDISKQTYINCWHHSEHESEAMWELYCKNPSEGVLIKTTREKLLGVLESSKLKKLTIKPVKYVSNYWIKHYNPEQDVFFRKRASFEHEKEYRAIFQNEPNQGGVHGHPIPVDLEKLIDEVRVSPLVNQTFFDLVKSSMESNGLTSTLNKSEIEIQPEMSVEEKLLSEEDGYKQYSIRLIGKYT
jgi:hypothetical protein